MTYFKKILYAILIGSLSAAGLILYATESKAANAAINQLPAAAAISGTDLTVVTQGGSPVLARQSPVSAFSTYLESTGKYILSAPAGDQSITTGALSISGKLSSPTFTATGITGAAQAGRFVGANASGAPATGTFLVGDYSIDYLGNMWICTVTGSPGTWVNVGSSSNLVTSVFGRAGAVVATSGDYTAAQVTNAADKSSASAQTFTAQIQSPTALVGIPSNIYTSPLQVGGSIMVANPANADQQLFFGYNATNGVGYVQAIQQGVGFKPLMLQAAGGNLGIGVPDSHVFTSTMDIGVSTSFQGAASFNVGQSITQAGGGLQFINSGAMTADSGISFLASSQDYRMSFESLAGARGWIRQNVDIADPIHGFAWSAGAVPNSNYFMILDSLGKLTLSASAHTATVQSLANFYGDLFLGNVASTTTPTAGGKFYAKSGLPYWKDSSGTETALIGSTPAYNIVNVTAATYTVTGAEDVIYIDSTANAVAVTVSSAALTRELKIYKKAGASNNITITPAGGQLINGSASAIIIYGVYDLNNYIKLVSSRDGTNMQLSGLSITLADATAGADLRPSGMQYQWGSTTYGPAIAAGATAQVTILWAANFPTAIFDAYPKVMEATSGVPISVKIVSQSVSDAVVQITNLSVTTATAPGIRVSAFAVGN
jgi:hypothetical protein